MSGNWAEQEERGSNTAISFAAFIYRLLGRRVSLLFLAPGVFYFYLTGGEQRRASRNYLKRAHGLGYLKRKPGFWTGFRHYMNFTSAMVDRLGSWLGKFKAKDIDGADGIPFSAAKEAGGALILTGHVGNPDLLRAVATVNRRFRVNVLMHTENAANYNGVINRLAHDSTVRLVQVKDIDVTVAVQLSEAIQAGEWVVMAADRTPAHGGGETLQVDFMNDKVDLPIGPYVLGAALKCPIYFLACIREKGGFSLVFEKISDCFELKRGARLESAAGYAQTYARHLENVVARAPLQWFNFYDFWRQSRQAPDNSSSDQEAQI